MLSNTIFNFILKTFGLATKAEKEEDIFRSSAYVNAAFISYLL